MRARHSKLIYGLVVAGFALSLTAMGMGCGDDDTTPSGGSGGSGGTGGSSGKGGTGGSSGKGGTGGSSGKGGSGGSAGGGMVTEATCNTNAATKTAGMIPEACYKCGCKEDPTTVDMCNGTTNCWQLIACVATKCAGKTGSEMTTCASTMCTSFLGAATPATSTGKVLQGTACASSCGTPSMMDGGVDAGN